MIELEIKEKLLSYFAVVENIEDLFSCKDDSVYLFPEHTGEYSAYLQDIGARAYVLALRSATLFPAHSLPQPKEFVKEKWWSGSRNFFEPIQQSGSHILLTKENSLFADSFNTNVLIPPSMTKVNENTWCLSVGENIPKLEGTSFYVDMISGQFGHALMDTSARLWAVDVLEQHSREPLRNVAVVNKGASAQFDSWPDWLKDLTEAYGIHSKSLTIVNSPLTFDRLLVARRISPFRHGGGSQFSKLMRLAGDRLQPKATAKSNSVGSKIFLSRGDNRRRALALETQSKLEDLFKSFGFTILDPLDYSLADQIKLTRNATYLAGCIGSQMYLASFSKRTDLKVLTISPSFFPLGRVDNLIAKYAGHSYTNIVIDAEIQPGVPPSSSSWEIPPDDFVRLETIVKDWKK